MSLHNTLHHKLISLGSSIFFVLVIVLPLMTGCGARSQALPTLAVLPTLDASPTVDNALSATATSEATHTRAAPTLPPTFTPTFTPALPTETALPATATATATLEVRSTSVLGNPIQNSENYPVNMRLSGANINMNGSPPSAVSYSLKSGTYKLVLQQVDSNAGQVTVHVEFLFGITAGSYNPAACSAVGNSIPSGASVCASVVFTDETRYAANREGQGSVTLTQIDPLILSADIPVSIRALPGSSGGGGSATMTLQVDGQAKTQP